MAAIQNSKRISCSELDFDAIKLNMKEFLRGQDQFQDYDFDGSSLSILLDVLAYNTHYRALYDNFMLNEAFLDSASKRTNVVSRAKEIGYTPSSSKAAIAYANVSVTGTVNAPGLLVLPKYSPFTATIHNTSYVFLTVEPYATNGVNSTFTFNNVKLVQGAYLVNRFAVSTGAKFIIPNANVDTTTLNVKVQENAQSNVYSTFYLTNNFAGIAATDRVYWLKEVEGELYELEFGNGVIGQSLQNGNVLHVEYMTTDSIAANGAKLFRYIGPQIYNGSTTVTTVSQSTGGTSIESVDSIKFNAPRINSTQNRAVTVEDYRNLIYNLVPEAASVNVWSGSDHIPPIYGKVFICIRPKTVETFTNIEKLTIKNDVIRSRNVATVIPEIIDPQYIFVALTVNVYYDPRTTTKSSNDIAIAVTSAISDYNSTELQKFDSIMRFSKLTRIIDEADKSIVSNVTNVILHRKVEPKFNSYATYIINLVNPIHAELSETSILTTGFYMDGSGIEYFIEDDGLGTMKLFHYVNSAKFIDNPRIGTVSYTLGLITINGLYINSVSNGEWKFIIKPSSYDVVSVLDQLVVISIPNLIVNVIADQSFGASGGGVNYTFTNSRS